MKQKRVVSENNFVLFQQKSNFLLKLTKCFYGAKKFICSKIFVLLLAKCLNREKQKFYFQQNNIVAIFLLQHFFCYCSKMVLHRKTLNSNFILLLQHLTKQNRSKMFHSQQFFVLLVANAYMKKKLSAYSICLLLQQNYCRISHTQ